MNKSRVLFSLSFAVFAILLWAARGARAATAVSATTRMTAPGVAGQVSGGSHYQQIQLPNELVTVGGGYPVVVEPATLDASSYHTASVKSVGGFEFFADTWSSSLGSASITLNEQSSPEQGFIFSNLSDQFALDGIPDGTAIRNATYSDASWLINTSGHSAAHSLFIKLHGILASAVHADRWLMASGKGRFAAQGSLLGYQEALFEWLLGFDGGSPETRHDFFRFSVPLDFTVSLNNFVVGYNDFSLDFALSKRFSAPDDQTVMTLQSTFTCIVNNATCAANTLTINDPVPSQVPSPLPVAGALGGWRFSRRLRNRIKAARRRQPLGPLREPA
jgi:hypothetical protein